MSNHSMNGIDDSDKVVDDVVTKEHVDPSAGSENGETAEREKKLVRKIDLFLLPTIWIVYLLSYMVSQMQEQQQQQQHLRLRSGILLTVWWVQDRSNLGNARIAGMEDALSITDHTYYLAVVLFQVGYVIAEVPCNMILARWRPSLFIPCIMVFWGAVCALVGLVQTWQQLVGLRFVLGIAEAGFSPAVMFIVSSWYKRAEQSKRFVVFHSAGIMSGAFGSMLAGAITSGLDGAMGIEGWRWLFIIEGVITVACAAPIPWILLDYPLTSKRLSTEERELAYGRLVNDGVTSRNIEEERAMSHWQALKVAVTNWRLIPLVAGYMSIIGCMSLAYFYPTFTALLGYSNRDAQYMTAPIYGVALVIAITMCIIADKLPQYRAIFTAGVLLIFGTVCSALASSIYNPAGKYVLLCFINTAIWCGNPLSLSYTSTVLGPVHPEVRAICLAIINGCANLAQLYGTYIFTVAEPPHYEMGFAVYSGIFAIGCGVYLASFFLFRKWPYQQVAWVA